MSVQLAGSTNRLIFFQCRIEKEVMRDRQALSIPQTCEMDKSYHQSSVLFRPEH